MERQAYLIFELSGSHYGIPAFAVQELFFLPELTALVEAPKGILGVINLRGEILPVLDLHHRLGRHSPPWRLTDSIVVLQWQTQRLGVLVNGVYEVQTIAPDQLSRNPFAARLPVLPTPALLEGIARLDDTLVTLLNPEILVQLTSRSEDWEILEQATGSAATTHLDQNHGPDPLAAGKTEDRTAHLSPKDRQILSDRANNLRQALDSQEAVEQMPLAVMGLGGEYFGLGLETVYEFTEVHKVTPIPCCPAHIVGNMNLRGEIITLVDIRPVLNLPNQGLVDDRKAIVVRLNQIVAGIVVDDIFDVLYVHPSEIVAAPVAMHAMNDEYLQGVIAYQNQMMSVISLSKLLSSNALVVNDEIS